MSRIGIQSIKIENGVTVEIKESPRSIVVKGPKGELTQEFSAEINIEEKEGEIFVSRSKETKSVRSLHGLYRSLVSNMIEGVTKGYDVELEIQGIGYRVQLKGKDLELSLGYSHPVIVEAPEGIVFEVPKETEIKVSGIDKQKVGEVAAKIRLLKRPEPYKGKGIRYKGEHVAIKQSAAAIAGGEG